jgi:hypothetical protein
MDLFDGFVSFPPCTGRACAQETNWEYGQSCVTFDIQRENGMPSSRAKANSCREDPAMTVTLPKNPRMSMRAVIALVAGRDPVTL